MKKVVKIKRICSNCNTVFFVYPSALKKDGCNYCSRKCFFIGLKNKPGWTSGAKGKHWKHTKEYCIKLSESRKGELNPAWKGGISFDRKKYKRGWKQEKWRIKVLNRDDYTCCECGKVGGQLVAHHIIPWSENKKLRFVIRNGNTLCFNCHQYIHWNERLMIYLSKKCVQTGRN